MCIRKHTNVCAPAEFVYLSTRAGMWVSVREPAHGVRYDIYVALVNDGLSLDVRAVFFLLFMPCQK